MMFEFVWCSKKMVFDPSLKSALQIVVICNYQGCLMLLLLLEHPILVKTKGYHILICNRWDKTLLVLGICYVHALFNATGWPKQFFVPRNGCDSEMVHLHFQLFVHKKLYSCQTQLEFTNRVIAISLHKKIVLVTLSMY